MTPLVKGDRVVVVNGYVLEGEVGTVAKTFMRYGHPMVHVDMDHLMFTSVTFYQRNLARIREVALPA